MALSTKVGSLQVREEELSSMLKLKVMSLLCVSQGYTIVLYLVWVEISSALVNGIYAPSLQDKDVTEASGHVDDLTARLRDLETTVTESSSRESELLRDSEENKRRCRESRREVTHLKGTKRRTPFAPLVLLNIAPCF